MANRIARGNVIILDSTGNFNFPGAGTQAKVSFIAFWASDSTGALQLAFQTSSTDVVVNMASPVNQPNTTTFRFPHTQYLNSMSVKTITAGTGYIYFA